MENKFYKVEQSGGTFVTGTFFNPVTKEEKREVLRDYDYADCSRDNDELYFLPIDKEVQKVWMHHHGQIVAGDTVEVVKGRKLPIGYKGIVKEIKPFRDKYGRTQCHYAYFTDGSKTNIDNCKLIG